jgi:hypothetical protein
VPDPTDVFQLKSNRTAKGHMEHCRNSHLRIWVSTDINSIIVEWSFQMLCPPFFGLGRFGKTVLTKRHDEPSMHDHIFACELFSAQHNWLIYIANDYHLLIIIIPSSNCHFIDSSHNSWHIPLITSPQISPFVNVYPKILGSCGKPNPINHPQWGFIKLAIPLALRWLNIAPEEKKSLAQPLRKKT